VTTTLVATPDPDDDPERAWHDTYGRQRAYDAARRIGEREAALELNTDPATMDEFDRIVAEKVARLMERPDGPGPAPDWPNPLTPYLIDWAEFWQQEHDETEWLLEPLFADGRAHALYAGAKTGKSYLILAACAALATGRPFLGHPGGEPVHVLYLDYEMSPQDVQERLVEFGYGPDVDMSHLHYALLPSLPPLDTDDGGVALLESSLALSARFVVVDTTSRAIQGDENDADTIRAFYRCTGLRLKQAGIGWMRLDHAGKDATKGQRGSSAKNDDVDVVARVERTDGGQRWLATHRRMAWYPELVEIAVTPGEDGITRFEMPAAVMWPEGTARLAADLDHIGVPLDAGRPAAREAMKDAGISGENKLVSAALKWRRMEAQRVADEAAERLSESIRNRAKNAADSPADSSYPQGTDMSDGHSGQSRKIKADSAADSCGQSFGAVADSWVSHVVDTHWPALPDNAPDDPLEDLF
jgi:hypothetical protein